MRALAADRRFPPALGFSLLAHVAVFLALRPPMPDLVARRVSPIIDVQFAAVAPLAEVAPQPVARPRPSRARRAPATAVAAKPAAPAKQATPEPARAAAAESAIRDEASEPAQPVEPPAPEPSETASPSEPSAPPAAPIAEARYEVQGINNPKPPYPLAARRQGLEGRVLLAARVLADGSCADVKLKQSSGHSLLDRAALETVKRWRFLPASRGGSAIDSWVDVPIRFRLEDRA